MLRIKCTLECIQLDFLSSPCLSLLLFYFQLLKILQCSVSLYLNLFFKQILFYSLFTNLLLLIL